MFCRSAGPATTSEVVEKTIEEDLAAAKNDPAYLARRLGALVSDGQEDEKEPQDEVLVWCCLLI